MNTRTFSSLSAPTLALAITLVGAGCGSGGTADADAQHDGTQATGYANGSGASANTQGVTGTGATTMGSNEIRINSARQGTPVYDERYAASKDIRGYRAQLMTELEAIRARLNDGTRPADAATKDQERAADLAQGLERMDRLLKAVEESDDLTWTSIHKSQLKEAGEVRVWATEHGFKVS